MSSNGTFVRSLSFTLHSHALISHPQINGEKIGKGHHALLREGNEIAFGQLKPSGENGGMQDYRFIYRHMAAGPPTRGLYKYYEIHHELGKGSFATVMKALHKEDGKWYAVKMIHSNKLRKGISAASSNGQEPAPTDGFAREISILESLNHTNICQLKEVFFESYSISESRLLSSRDVES